MCRVSLDKIRKVSQELPVFQTIVISNYMGECKSKADDGKKKVREELNVEILFLPLLL